MSTLHLAITAISSGCTAEAVRRLSLIGSALEVSLLVQSRARTRSALAQVRGELESEREAHAAVCAERDELAAANVGLTSTMDSLLQPARVGECSKIQLHTHDAAVTFARKVEAETRAGDMEPYRCDACPRNPATGERIWHIRHVRPTQRGHHWTTPASPTRVARRVTPEVIAQLKSRTGGAA
jgi:hypothetical protein